MKGFDPDATIRVDGHEPVPVWNIQMTTARPDSDLARHWLTGQPLQGAYLRRMPLRTPGSITFTVTADTSGLQAFFKGVDQMIAEILHAAGGGQ